VVSTVFLAFSAAYGAHRKGTGGKDGKKTG
jgi:hypothetical protein